MPACLTVGVDVEAPLKQGQTVYVAVCGLVMFDDDVTVISCNERISTIR